MNLLVTGAFNCQENELNMLRRLGHNVVFMQNEKSPLPCDSSWVEGIIGNGIFLTHPIEQFTALKYIQLTSAGFDRVPMDYIKQHGIEIHNARGVYSIPMAEFAICGVLQLYKQSRFFYENQELCRWKKNRDLLELFGKNICIIGCGSVGNECAKRFKAFGCNITGIDITPYQNELYDEMLPLCRLDDVLPKADVLILTLPLSEKTHHIINRTRLLLLKKSAVIVNIARGAVIDTEALIEVLSQLGGAVLDVFEDEPLEPQSALWQADNVIITPHNSFVGENNNNRLSELVIKNLQKDM